MAWAQVGNGGKLESGVPWHCTKTRGRKAMTIGASWSHTVVGEKGCNLRLNEIFLLTFGDGVVILRTVGLDHQSPRNDSFGGWCPTRRLAAPRSVFGHCRVHRGFERRIYASIRAIHPVLTINFTRECRI